MSFIFTVSAEDQTVPDYLSVNLATISEGFFLESHIWCEPYGNKNEGRKMERGRNFIKKSLVKN